MPARFINVNNSGRANFRNVNNSGRALFGSGSISAGTTTTTTTATTCYCFGVIPDNGSCVVEYTVCSTGTTTTTTVDVSTRYLCSRTLPTYVSGGTPTIFACNSGGFPQTCVQNNGTDCTNCVA
jgi:hypothetical protein